MVMKMSGESVGLEFLSNKTLNVLGGSLKFHIPAVGKECTRQPHEASSHRGIHLVAVDV